jgi:hypothetical protein
MEYQPTNYQPQLDAAVEELLHQVAEMIAEDARRYCPIGDLEDHDYDEHPLLLVETIVAEGHRVYIGQRRGRNIWHYIEYGTPPHEIVPRRPPYRNATGRLVHPALFWDGAPHPVRRVHHPGTPEYAPMRRALYQRRAPKP